MILVLGAWLVLGFAFAQGPSPLYHVSYIERRGAEVRSLEARVVGKEIFIDRLQGRFPKDLKDNPPWYLQGLPSLEESVPLFLEDLPSLTLERKFEFEKEPGLHRVTLNLQAPEEMNFEIQRIDLEGEGRLSTSADRQEIAVEEFVLRGEVWREETREPWSIEYARAREER